MSDPAAPVGLDPDSTPVSLPSAMSPSLLLLVAGGAVAGTLVRYGLSRAVPTSAGHFPVSTFTVNVLGAFVLGALLEALTRPGPETARRRRLRLLGGTGFCGALTTYSTLAVEADQLVRHHDAALAAGYAAASVLAGLVACGAGVVAAARVRGS